MTIESWRVNALTRMILRFEEVGFQRGLMQSRHWALIVPSGGEPGPNTSQLMQGEPDYRFFLTLGNDQYWLCGGDWSEEASAGLFLDLAARAGGLLAPELSAALAVEPGVVSNDDLWTIALHHFAWARVPGAPFECFCTTYEEDEKGDPEPTNWDAEPPRRHAVFPLLTSEISGDPFAVSALLIEALLDVDLDHWDTLFGSQLIGIELHESMVAYLGSIDVRRKAGLLVGAIAELAGLADGQIRSEAVGRSALMAHVAGAIGIEETQALSQFRNAWDSLPSYARSSGAPEKHHEAPLVWDSSDRKPYTLSKKCEEAKGYLQSWGEFRKTLPAYLTHASAD